MNALRDIVRTNESLAEDYKWMHPCYTFQGKNIVLIHSFKEYCALLFHKGSLLEDPQGLLIQHTENVQDARQLRFTSLQQIPALAPTVRYFIHAATPFTNSR